MKKFMVSILLFFSLSITQFFVLPVTNANANFVLYEYYTYFGNTGEEVTVSWDAVAEEDPNYITYEIRLKHVEQQIYVPVGTTSNTQVTFILPKSGHYIVEARTIRTVTGEEPVVGDWTDSTKNGMIDSELKSWWLYGKIASPGEIIIGSITNTFSSIYNFIFS